jgi:hypothetical protein
MYVCTFDYTKITFDVMAQQIRNKELDLLVHSTCDIVCSALNKHGSKGYKRN